MDDVNIDNRADSFLCFLYSGATSVEEEVAVVKMIHVLLVQFPSMSSRKVLDRVLLRADVDKLTTMIMVTILTVTAKMKMLKYRTDFFVRCLDKLNNRYWPGYGKTCLVGLEQSDGASSESAS